MSSLVYVGKVKSTKDPLSLGRIQVMIEGFPEQLELPWVRYIQPLASNKSGFLFLPEEGDEVAILRAQEDYIDGMLAIGSLYNGKNKPKVPDSNGKNEVKQILTKAGHEITLTDKKGSESILIKTAKGKIKLELTDKDGTLKITSDKKIVLETTDFTLTAKNSIKMQAKMVEIKADMSMKIDGGKQLAIKGMMTKMEGQKIDIAGMMINLG